MPVLRSPSVTKNPNTALWLVLISHSAEGRWLSCHKRLVTYFVTHKLKFHAGDYVGDNSRHAKNFKDRQIGEIL